MRPMPPIFTSLACGLLLLGSVSSAHAALTISHTRIIHDSAKRSASVIIANPSDRTFAAQAWVNTEADDQTTPVALVASPSLFRIDPGKEQSVQINALPNDLPQDRESLFYFNLQEIPQTQPGDAQNALTIALRTRIKLFYRPSMLGKTPQDGLKDLTWSVQMVEGKAHLVVNNPTPYHYTFNNVVVSSASTSERVNANNMAPPLGRQSYPLRSFSAADDLEVRFTTINDYSGTSAELTSPVARQ